MSIKYNGKLIAGKYKTQVVTDATEGNKGLIRIATLEEVNAGTDNTTAVTPKGLATKQNKLTAGTGIEITEDNVINNTQTSAEWGNIQGDIINQSDLIDKFGKKQDVIPDLENIRDGANKGSTSIQAGDNISTLINDAGYLTDSTLPVGSDTQKGIVQVDNITIESYSGVLASIATKTKSNTIKIDWEGTNAEYEAGIADGSISSDWYCYITDDETIVDFNDFANNSLSNLSEAGLKVIKDNSGSGLEICDIGMALYIDETKGLRRYLNGQIVDRNANTEAFFTRLQEITTLHPSLLCTEDEWQTAKTMSAFGQVGKFVFNYSGDKIVSVRIPAIVNVQGLFDLQNLGITVSESLPNIKGSLSATCSGANGNLPTRVGCMDATGTGVMLNAGTGSVYVNNAAISVDASRSSSTYQDGAHVQPEAIQYPYFIQIATGSETENNIVNDIELNNPYGLFDFKWADHELNNISWTRADNFDWKSSATYPSAYNELLAEYNNAESVEETEGTVTFKRTPKGYKIALSTQETAILNKYNTDGIAWYYILDTTNTQFKLPRTKYGFEGLRTNVGDKIDESLPNIKAGKITISDWGGIETEITGAWEGSSNPNSTNLSSGNTATEYFISFNASRSSSTYQDGAPVQERATQMYLYFYVGETVQNANLIDAGRISEILPNKLDKKQLYNKITSCLLEVPQRVKLELNDGTLTLKAGSQVIVPNGFEADGTTPKFDYVTVESDTSKTYSWAPSSATQCMLFLKTDRDIGAITEIRGVMSGATPPTTAYTIWYDTQNNIVKRTGSSASIIEVSGLSFPFAIINQGSDGITKSIDQVFNGIGYIGSTVWVDKGVKGLIPNGRNADGTLNNVEFVTKQLFTRTMPNFTFAGIFPCLYMDFPTKPNIIYNGEIKGVDYINGAQIGGTPPSSGWWFDIENNYWKYSGVISRWVPFGLFDLTNGVISNFQLKQPFRAVDYNDFRSEVDGKTDMQQAAQASKPSGRYIDLTLGASGVVYTAPADGFIALRYNTNATFCYCHLYNSSTHYGTTKFYSLSGLNGMLQNLEVQGGSTFQIDYSGLDFSLFRFIYAEGSK